MNDEKNFGMGVAHATNRSIEILQVMESREMILKLLQAHRELAEVKRLAIISVMRELSFREKAQELEAKHWTQFVEPEYEYLKRQAAEIGIVWIENEVPVIDTEINIERRTSLRRAIRGALQDTIGTHGPIHKANFTSAAKRIEGAILTYNHLIRTKK